MKTALRLSVLGSVASICLVAATTVDSTATRGPLPDVPANAPAWVSNALVKDNVDTEVTKLDAIVHLNPNQALAAGEIFAQRLQDVTAAGGFFTPASRKAHETATVAIEALLTPDQRLAYNSTPMSDGGQSPFARTVDRVGYLDSGVQLSPEQMKSVAAILEEEVRTVAAASVQERRTTLPGVERATAIQIKGLLTAAQVEKFTMGGEGVERQLPLRILVGERIRASKQIESVVGPVASAKPRGMRCSYGGANGQFSEATLKYEVTGSKGSEILTFRLVGDDLGRPTITKVTDPQGADVAI